MKTAISIPDDLFRVAERTAQRLGLSRSEMYRRALKAYLRQHDERLVTETLDAIYGKDTPDEGVDPALDELQRAALPDEDWE